MTEPAPAPPAVPGYRLFHRLSRSPGPTEVWAAEAGPGRPVALKLLAPWGAAREDLALRFVREGEILEAVGGSHGVVRCLGLLSGPPAIVLERLDQRSLADRLHPAGAGGPVVPIGPGPAIAVGIGLADALRWLHSHDVIHRDVKPANLLFAADGSIRLIDLGVAARGRPPSGLPEGWIEERVGTLGRAAPELLADAATATPALDVYGLGVTLYEALSGHLPYDFRPGESEAGLRRRIVAREPPVPLGVRAPSLPADLARLIDAAVDPDPAGRPPLAGLDAALASLRS